MTQARLLPLPLATVAVLSSLALAAVTGCEGVPTLDFGSDDGGLGDAADASDGGDGGTPADAAKEAATTTCPAAVPLGAAGCCDTVPCVGKNCEQQCAQKNCSACASTGEYCCALGAGRCITPGAACP